MRKSVIIALFGVFVFWSTPLSAQGPVPEFFGVYALQDGKLIEFDDNSDLNDFVPKVSFIVFIKEQVQLIDKMFFLPPEEIRDIATRTTCTVRQAKWIRKRYVVRTYPRLPGESSPRARLGQLPSVPSTARNV